MAKIKLKQVRLRKEIYDTLCSVKDSFPPKRSKEDILNDAAAVGLAEMTKKKTTYLAAA